ncbi:unnamed protein product [Zymoseptoria tritici ST99CH_1A5]|uniref:Uncharacterized protein n=1 Tax=Zymoseptoria tritici ST99CH_1A5 TaxID=1276529 RepID=A0A1Y6LV69_ZYMTR|nr:unnamed protein product [Zymoseptoria tritici ST99CH_1A5]
MKRSSVRPETAKWKNRPTEQNHDTISSRHHQHHNCTHQAESKASSAEQVTRSLLLCDVDCEKADLFFVGLTWVDSRRPASYQRQAVACLSGPGFVRRILLAALVFVVIFWQAEDSKEPTLLVAPRPGTALIITAPVPASAID